MKPHVLISSGSGNGNLADEILLAGAVRLLERGAHHGARALSGNLLVSQRAHPQVEFVSSDDIDGALSQSRLLVVIGDLARPEELERAAQHVVRAKLAGVPAALVSVRLGDGTSTPRMRAQLEILAQCESISTCDARSAHALSTLCGRRIDTTAPLELVVPKLRERDDGSSTIGICEQSLAASSHAQRVALSTALEELVRRGRAKVTLLAVHASSLDEAPAAFERVVSTNHQHWAEVIDGCRMFIGSSGSVALHLAAANGSVPIALADAAAESDLHARLGMPRLVVRPSAATREWASVLESALAHRPDEIRFRCSPLRAVAWRGLGHLSDARASRELTLKGCHEEACALVSDALLQRLRPWLDRGDVLICEAELARWEESLQSHPRWAEARARVWSLQGCDGEARRLLEQSLAHHPDDAACLAALAMVAFRLGDTGTSESCWKRVACLQPDSAFAAEQLGCLEMLRGRPDAAQEAWSEALRRDTGRSVRAAEHQLGPLAGLAPDRPSHSSP